MSDYEKKIKEQTKALRRLASEQSYPVNYRNCMLAASELVEEAAFCLTRDEPGRRVAELLLLATRLEDLSEQSESNQPQP